jgi:hypothetical protein
MSSELRLDRKIAMLKPHVPHGTQNILTTVKTITIFPSHTNIIYNNTHRNNIFFTKTTDRITTIHLPADKKIY